MQVGILYVCGFIVLVFALFYVFIQSAFDNEELERKRAQLAEVQRKRKDLEELERQLEEAISRASTPTSESGRSSRNYLRPEKPSISPIISREEGTATPSSLSAHSLASAPDTLQKYSAQSSVQSSQAESLVPKPNGPIDAELSESETLPATQLALEIASSVPQALNEPSPTPVDAYDTQQRKEEHAQPPREVHSIC